MKVICLFLMLILLSPLRPQLGYHFFKEALPASSPGPALFYALLTPKNSVSPAHGTGPGLKIAQ